MKRMQRAILFDLDGVLVSTTDCEIEAWRRLFEEAGVSFSSELYHEFTGMPAAKVAEKYFGEDFSGEKGAAFQERKTGYVMECLQRVGLKIAPGAPELVREVSSDYRLAIVTGGAHRRAVSSAQDMGVEELFGSMVGADDVEVGKPDPEPFLKAAGELGVEPNGCVVIEDGIAGVEGAKAGGMKTVAVTTTNPAEAFPEVDLIVPTISELTKERIDALWE